jgi:hypothetical protein
MRTRTCRGTSIRSSIRRRPPQDTAANNRQSRPPTTRRNNGISTTGPGAAKSAGTSNSRREYRRSIVRRYCRRRTRRRFPRDTPSCIRKTRCTRTCRNNCVRIRSGHDGTNRTSMTRMARRGIPATTNSNLRRRCRVASTFEKYYGWMGGIWRRREGVM